MQVYGRKAQVFEIVRLDTPGEVSAALILRVADINFLSVRNFAENFAETLSDFFR